MIDFEESDARQNVGDAIIAVPPEGNRRGQQRKLYRIGAFPFRPHPGEIEQEQDPHCDGNAQDDLLRVVQEPRRNEGPATGVVRLERVSHALRGKKHRRRKPDCTGGKIEPTCDRGK